MRRREFLKQTGLGLAGAAAGLTWLNAGAQQKTDAPRPNIVIFLSDDMPWNMVGFNGSTRGLTPNLDRLAREGTRLEQFYVCSVCSPTRAALLTGRYPFRNGMEERTHGRDVAGMLTDERTLAQALQEAGYFTAITGKWHLGEWFKKHLPLQRGFEHQYGFYGALIDSFNHCRDDVYDWHRNEQPIYEEGYTSFLIADEVERLLEKRDPARPFFFYVPFNAVHSPHLAPEEFVKKNKGDVLAAQLECMDIAIGRVLGSLETRGLLHRTLVIFFNDNGGPGAGEPNAPWRGGKGTNYEGGVRVPCLMRWPGRLAAGARAAGPVHVVDLYPTLVKLAGGELEQPLPLDGMDVWPALAGGKPSPRSEVVLSLPDPEGLGVETGTAAIIQGKMKLVGDELYDLEQDPYEKNNLAAQQPEVTGRLKARLAALVKERRKSEAHDKIPDEPLVIYGELENRGKLPEAILKQHAALLRSPDTKKAKRAQKKAAGKAGKKKRAQ